VLAVAHEVRTTAPGRLVKFLRSEFVRHGALAFSATLAAQICNFTFHLYNSRALGVVRYGDLFSLINVLLIVQGVFAQMVTYVVVRYAAEFHAVGDRDRLRALCERTLIWTSLGALAVVLASLALKGTVAAFLHLSDARSVPALGCLIGVWLMLPAVRGVLQGAQDFRRYGASMVIEGVLLVTFGCGLVAAGYGVPGALFGWSLASACSLTYGYVAARRYFGAPRATLNFDLRRLRQTSSGVAVTLVAITLGLCDVVLVKHFFAPEVAGLYAAVALCGRVIFFVVSFVPTVILPKASAIAARGESPVPLARRAFFALAILAGLALLVLATAPGFIVEVLTGSQYAGAAHYVFAYGVAMTLLAGTQIATAYKIGLHRFSYVPWLLLAMFGELVVIAVWHATIWNVIYALIAGNSCALLISAHGVLSEGRRL
jgi:O-antigen/teichoic acid export membrane protein